MNAEEESHIKKKAEKSSTDNITVTVDKIDSKRLDQGSDEDPKPRIVLTFRSDKNRAKNSNMKIVSSEEKQEEAPRRSSRTRKQWEWVCDSDTSPKKDKSGTQTTSENDESDSSHNASKRSARRHSKDIDNVLANAIARKEKSYETQSTPQRLSRRIKPTAKVLENEELRIGVESQNNARLGIQTDKSPEGGVRTRRSARPAVTEKKIEPEIIDDEVVEIATTDDDSQSQNSVLKLKHLCELGLKARSPDDVDESGNEHRDEEEEIETEDLEEDDEIDDDPNVISKLLETDEDSDDEYLCALEVKKHKPRTRRSTRLNSSYGNHDSDQSSPVPEEEHKSRRSIKRRAKPPPGALLDHTEDSFGHRSKRKRNKSWNNDEVQSDGELEETSNPAGGDEGSEAACPVDESAIVATCYCEATSNVYAAPEELTEPVFCQAVELVDGTRVGCSHRASGRGGALGAMLRAGPRAPYFLACALHAAQLAKHMCCPACGLFCTQGEFYQCSSGHLFHLECGLPYHDAKAKPGCPHCGVFSYRWTPANTECGRVRVQMRCSNKRIYLPDQREQCTPAFLSFSKPPMEQERGPIVPQELLPSPPIQLTELRQGPPQCPSLLCADILRGEGVDLLLAKLVSSSHINKPLDSQSGGTCMHAAARSGHVAAVYLLHYAGANVDATDCTMRTPLMVAIVALLDNSNDKDKEKLKDTSNTESEVMEVDPDVSDVKTEKDDSKTVTIDVKIERDGDKDDIESDKTEKDDLTEPEVDRTAIVVDNIKKEDDKIEIEDDKIEIEDDKIVIEDDKTTKGGDGIVKEGVMIKIEVSEEIEKTEDVLKKPKEEDLIKVMRYLLAAGCDVNFPGPAGMTALHLCSQLGGPLAPRVVSLLLSHSRTKLELKDQGGWTPLVWAAEKDHVDVVQVLLDGGADPLSADAEGNSPLHWSALGGASGALGLLLDRAPHAVSTLNAHGDTPLHIAARQGNYSCVVKLLARGARMDVENSSGQLPVEVCSGQCQSAVSLHMQMAIAVRGKLSRHRLLSADISKGREPIPIPCVNEVDEETLPEEFTYVTRHVTPHPITIDTSIETMQGCTCADGGCSSVTCTCCGLGVRGWYSNGRLMHNFPYHDPPMLFECNQTCGCDLRVCNNSVVSKATLSGAMSVRTEVFRIGGAKGWGLRARQDIARGTCVGAYCGELLAAELADTRPADHYMFALDVKQDLLQSADTQRGEAEALRVDASRFGSALRFVNHACAPNAAPVRVFAHARDLRLPVVALFARDHIPAGVEITFDYGDKFWSVKSKWMRCECGHSECRYPAKTEEVESS